MSIPDPNETIVTRARRLRTSDASVEDASGVRSLASILDEAYALAAWLAARGVERGDRVFLAGAASAAWARAFFAVLGLGAVAVPVAVSASRAELEVLAKDAGAKLALLTNDADLPFPPSLAVERAVAVPPLAGDGPAFFGAAPADVAMILYTSGTTGAPKGAMLTHANLLAQIAILRRAWGMSPDDVLLHALPMHHLHGIVVAFLTTLLTPARVIALPKFSPEGVLARLDDATVLMAVPTMYVRIVEAFDRASPEDRARWGERFRRLRLLTSGSAALPASLAERLRAIAGVLPLERYGMTEIGMALSNPLDPDGRRPGRVGMPLPTVEAKIVADDGSDGDGPGELWVRGPSVFAGYLGREDETRASFRAGGWFATGDVAERDGEGSVRLLGRSSTDILKSGGEKISALEIEEALREHASVLDAAVIGLPDPLWGDRVVAVVVPREGVETSPDAIVAFMKTRVAPFKVPKEVRFVASLPRNAMGKVQKKELAGKLAAG